MIACRAFFQLNGVQARFALLDGMALKKSGYVLVSGPLPADVDPTDFTVDNSRLTVRTWHQDEVVRRNRLLPDCDRAEGQPIP
jgi:hypothetical protein